MGQLKKWNKKSIFNKRILSMIYNYSTVYNYTVVM